MAAGLSKEGGIGNERTYLATFRIHVTFQEPSFQNKLNLVGSSSPPLQKCDFLLLRSKAYKRAQKTPWTSNSSYKIAF
jgi:hypothetical protein